MSKTNLEIEYRDDIVILTCDLSSASAPLVVDGQPTQYQTADARHDTARAVRLVARLSWPEVERASWEEGGEAWDDLSYEELAAEADDEEIQALQEEAVEVGHLSLSAVCDLALWGVEEGLPRLPSTLSRGLAEKLERMSDAGAQLWCRSECGRALGLSEWGRVLEMRWAL